MNYIKRLLPLLLCIAMTVANATTMQSLSLTQKTQRSDRVVVASVERIQYEKHPTLHRIYTLTTLKVLDSLKGDAKPNMHLIVRQIGGTLGEWTQHIAGDAKFVQGEEVLVFLRHDPKDDLHFVVGISQGKVSVDIGSDTVKGHAYTHGVNAHAHHPTVQIKHPERGPLQSEALSGLVQRIRDIATAPPSPSQ